MRFVVRVPQMVLGFALALLSTGAWSAWRNKRSQRLDIDIEEDTIYG